MNDAWRWKMIDDIKAVCKALGITILLNTELISLMQRSEAKGRDYAMFQNFRTIEEAWAFLDGYCTAKDHDIHALASKAAE